MHHHEIPPNTGLIFGGSGTSFFGGIFAAVTSSDPSISFAGLLLAIAGLITALASLFVPIARIWSDNQRAERERRTADHDLSNKLNAASLRITELEELRQQDARIIGQFMEKLAHNIVQPDRAVRPERPEGKVPQ
jgi:hypothetical protein